MKNQELDHAIEVKCTECGCTDWAWPEDAAMHICIDCFACNEEQYEIEE